MSGLRGRECCHSAPPALRRALLNNARMAATQPASSRASNALRLARQAWRLLHVDSRRAIDCAEKALARALAQGDVPAEGWARLARGIHLLYFATPGAAAPELEAAKRCFDAAGDRTGHLLAATGLARGLWRSGRFEASLAAALALRDEGLRVLRPEQRGILLNTIAGCHSALGHSEEAFAYMFQALRDAGPSQAHGFDVVLHCNLAHEHVQLGDYDEALRHVDQGISRCKRLDNVRLLSILLLNRVICLTELDRTHEALPDIARILDLPADTGGRGLMSAGFETLAIAALSAGDVTLGSDLVERSHAAPAAPDPDEQVERVVAAAMLDQARGQLAQALRRLEPMKATAGGAGVSGLNLRLRCRFFLLLAGVHEALGDPAAALAAMREWQRLQIERAGLAARARYQAAALQTELLRLQHKLDDNVARRRATERARADLATINEQLSRKVDEVEALQTALKRQATRDFLTGLFNRRHLNDVLPGMLALAARDRQPLAVAMIDLDFFKAVNDRFGHDAGDHLLTAFGTLLTRRMRKSDIACRYGGEEFCLVMPRTDARGAARKINTLLRHWRAARFEFGAEALEDLTFSAGVVDSRAAPESGAELIKAADETLLAAKDAGRARVLTTGEIAAQTA